MSKVAFIGLGAMGARMATNLMKAGHQVTVYDLMPAAAERLVSAGAKKAATAREAAEGNDFVLTMVRDDEASRQVWLDAEKGALAGMKPGAIAVEISTLTPAWIRELGATLGKSGFALLEAPVSGSTPQAESAQLIFLVGGDAEALRVATPLFEVMGSGVHHAGAHGAGALAKLITNAFMAVQLTTLAEMIGMLKTQPDVNPHQVLGAVAGTPMWNAHLTRDADSMLSGNFETHFPIQLLAKDLAYTVKTAGGEANVPTVSAVHAVFARAMAEKLGELDMTAVVKLFEAGSGAKPG